jgi:hypothetical protein
MPKSMAGPVSNVSLWRQQRTPQAMVRVRVLGQ